MEYAQIALELRIILNFLLRKLVHETILLGNLSFFCMVTKTVACVVNLRKEAEELRIVIILKSF